MGDEKNEKDHVRTEKEPKREGKGNLGCTKFKEGL